MEQKHSIDSTDLTRVPTWANEEDTERESRRRSLECSAVDVRIVGSELTHGHVSYKIQVTSGIKKWTVYRRFRDFYYLDQRLQKVFPNIVLPSLPPKRFLKSSSDREVVDERKDQLEIYLRSLLPLSIIWTRNDLVLFLDNDSNSMMFIWNFEKMRKMQDVS
jgi:hypothetical protein